MSARFRRINKLRAVIDRAYSCVVHDRPLDIPGYLKDSSGARPWGYSSRHDSHKRLSYSCHPVTTLLRKQGDKPLDGVRERAVGLSALLFEVVLRQYQFVQAGQGCNAEPEHGTGREVKIIITDQVRPLHTG